MHAIFYEHRKFLNAGIICIHASMISIPAGKILENEKSISNKIFFYLHAIFNQQRDFYMRA